MLISLVIFLSTISYWRWISTWLVAWQENMGSDKQFHLTAGKVVDERDVPFLSRVDRELSLISEKVRNSVVAIESKGSVEVIVFGYSGITYYPMFVRQSSSGSGVVVTKEGHVITNYHVVAGKRNFKLTFPNGLRYIAEKVGSDRNLDIAVLKIISSEKFSPLPFGNSDNVKVGQTVLSFGNAYGAGIGVSRGIVSVERKFISNTHFHRIQTDAAVHPGYSGGPVINIYGQIIGLNTDRLTGNRYDMAAGIPNLGFAIPSNYVADSFSKICAYPQWVVNNMGLKILFDDTMEKSTYHRYLKCPCDGVVINEVVPNSQAEALGIKHGDVIVECNGIPIREHSDLQKTLKDSSLENPIQFILWRGWRGGKPKERKSYSMVVNASTENLRHFMRFMDISVLGIRLTAMPISEEVKCNTSGLVINSLTANSILAGNLMPDDIITSVNGIAVIDKESLAEILKAKPKRFKINYIRGNKPLSTTVNLDKQKPDRLSSSR